MSSCSICKMKSCAHVNNVCKRHKKKYVEEIVCKDSDFEGNEMKTFQLAGESILVVKQNGSYFSLKNRCSHYGADLCKGVLGNGRVRCPLHGACFNLSTGDIEDFPGLDGVPCFSVNVQPDGGVQVRAREDLLHSERVIKHMNIRDKGNTDTIVIAGGGPAGLVCAETLRQNFTGRIILVCKEPHLPYDRIKASKALDKTFDELKLRDQEFFDKYDIEIMRGVEVTGVDVEQKSIQLSNGTDETFTLLFLATGSYPIVPPIPGVNLENIFVLRTIDDANNINSKLDFNTDVVIVGSSFIGMEVAAFCAGKVKSVSVIDMLEIPFEKVFGPLIGKRLMEMQEENGVKFFMNSGVKQFLPQEDDSSKVGNVEIADGSVIAANVVVLGIGVKPNTLFLQSSGVVLQENGTIPVNEFLETSVEGIYAGGDIACAPVLNSVAAIGHWQLAHYHGRISGRNMAGIKTPLKAVPFFWTVMYGKSLRYVGFAPNWDDVYISGNLIDLEFVAFYCVENDVVAVATMNSDPFAARYAELLASGGKLTKEEALSDPQWVRK